MKRNNKIMAAAALCAVVVTFSACKDELGFGNVLTPDPSDAICFVTSGSIGASSEPFTRSAGYVDETVEEWTIEGTPSDTSATTRAAVKSSLYADFNPAGVRIFLYNNWDDSTEPNMQVPASDQLSAMPALPGTFNAEGVLSPPETILWASTKEKYALSGGSGDNYTYMRTYAMGRLTDINRLCHDGTSEPSDDTAGAHMEFHGGDIGTPPYIVYTTPDEPKDQIDLIAAYSGEMTVADVYGQQVPLTFYHGLSAVQFKLDFDKTVRVKSLTVTGVYKKGKCDIGENGNNVWDFASYTGEGTYTYTWPFNDGVNDYKLYTASDGHTENGVLTDGDETLLMIPQTLPEGAKVILEYQEEISSTWTSKQIVCDISGFQWSAGHRYIYTIKEEPTYDIFFDLAAGDITVDGSTYTGCVYKNTATTPEIATITGTHSASNKYYVYQSVPNGTTGYESSPGYNKGWTGDISSDGRTPGAGSTLDLPKYAELKVGDVNWSDYITGNFDRNTVKTTFNTKVAECGRVSTNYRIWANVANADVTIDNVYSTRTHTQTYNSNNGATASHRVGNLKLKGDSRLLNLAVLGNTLTSYYGDGSKRGSLVLVDYRNVNYNNHDNTCYFRPANGFTMKGGVLYCATAPLYAGWATTAFGGDCVSIGGGQTFNMAGGVLTAMAWGNMAAIGGGATNTASIAQTPSYINIYGGEVYAYAGGVYQPSSGTLSGFRQFNTAIGGASSTTRSAGNSQINIYGNAYVVAVSKGGAAIGGGASGTAKGGKGMVNIYGNAKVIAKSISGYVESSTANYSSIYVPAGTAIGGGKGGAGKSTSTNNGRVPATENIGHGGDAEVNVYGNATLIAGSVGGGGRGTLANGTTPALVGNATVKIYGNADVQMQAVMADTGGDKSPSFSMSSGTLHLVDDSYEFSQPDGGAVWMDSGNCTIEGGTISDFRAGNGGAIYIYRNSTSTSSTPINFTMSGGTIKNCKAEYDRGGGNGGALYISDAKGLATVNILGGTISGNYTDYNGGGVYLEGGNVNISGGTLTGNKALEKNQDDYGNGGGIYLMKGNYTMTGGTISGNTANSNGGGVFVSSPSASGNDITVDIRQGTITRNSSERFGAGLYVKPGGSNSATVNIGISGETSNTDPEITWNSASLRGGGIYVEGSKARLNMYEGLVKNNSVSAYVYNQDIANQNGEVTLALNSTTGLPIPDLYYITITFDPAGGNFTDGNTAGTSSKTYLVKSTDSKLNIPTPKRRNFTFKGWVPSQGEADTGHADSEYDNATGGSMTFNYDKDITLTATWQAN